MKWYYVHSGRQAGPVEENQLTELLDSGKIQPDTLVWHEAMPDWKPYEEAIPKTVATKSLVLPAPPIASPIRAQSAETNREGTPEAVCSECGRMFSIESTTKIGESRVCANCKPRLLQKFNEKGRVEGVLSYAGFWTRFAAYFLDRIIVGAVISTLLWATGASGNSHSIFQQSNFSGLTLFIFTFSIFLPMAYETFMVGKYGGTLGKMACKIHIVTADGESVGFLRAAARYFAKLLSGVVCAVGYLIAIFDEQKRALHDRICDTRVVMS